MTTIACDGKAVAADGMITAGSEVLRRDALKIERLGDAVLGFGGIAALQKPVVQWFANGADPEAISGALAEREWTLAAFNAAGAITYHNDCPLPSETYSYPFAIGCGEQFARGAMLAGASAVRAVEIAAICSALTGGAIVEIKIPTQAIALATCEAA